MNSWILNLMLVIVFFVMIYWLFKLIKRRIEIKKIVNNASDILLKQDYDFYFQGGLKYDFKRDLNDPKYFDNLKIEMENKLKEIEKKNQEESIKIKEKQQEKGIIQKPKKKRIKKKR